ncbi:MAG: ATP-binding protein [Planctomycetota bacterium]
MKPSKSVITEIYFILLTTSLVVLNLGFFVFSSIDNRTFELLSMVAMVGGGSFCLLRMLALTRRLKTVQVVERQLSAVGAVAGASPVAAPKNYDSLSPVLSPSRIGQGWNQLVESLQEKEVDREIDRRMETLAGGQKSEKFARALRSLNDGLAISDADQRITYANTAFEAMLLGEPDQRELQDSPIREVLGEVGYHNWHEHADELFAGTKPINVNLKLGASIHDGVHQVSRMPLEGRFAEQSGFVWTLRDVTQQCIARESHEQFLASATHELRTPLTNIRAYTESLLTQQEATPEQQKEFYNVIHTEAARLGRLLNELLDIQQLEAGSMTIQANQFEIQRMVAEIQDHLNPLLAEQDQKFVCRIAPDLTSIEADKEKVTSCLINLLGNAVKYTPQGGEIRLLAERIDTWIEITVVDTGIGIAEEELPKIFDRFYRCDDERVGEIEGNGLGLAFCQEVARLHGGDLVVESQLDKGSRFTLRLPATSSE